MAILFNVKQPPSFSPVDFEGLYFWLKSDTGVTFSEGTTVDYWYDQSENSFVFGTSGGGPQLVSNELNGYPAVVFNGTNDRISLGGSSPGLGTWFLVYKVNNITSGGSIFMTYGGIYNESYCVDPTQTELLWVHQAEHKECSYPAVIGDGVYTVASITFNTLGNISAIYENGALRTSCDNINFLNLGTTHIAYGQPPGTGTNSYVPLSLVEMVYYKENYLSDSDRQTVESYLNSKYSIY